MWFFVTLMFFGVLGVGCFVWLVMLDIKEDRTLEALYRRDIGKKVPRKRERKKGSDA